MGITISKCKDLSGVYQLFNEHLSERFVYPADICLIDILKNSDYFILYQALINGRVVGCIYAFNYMYNCGWIGGLLVHRNFRHLGIGSKLLSTVLNELNVKHIFIFIEDRNEYAKKLFKKFGFREVYKKLSYVIPIYLKDYNLPYCEISHDVEYKDLTKSLGFKERCGVITLGYFPIKLNEDTFNDLKRKGKIIRCGDVIAIIEKSYCFYTKGYGFIFNSYLLSEVEIPRNVVYDVVLEINPLYIRPNSLDLMLLILYLAKLYNVGKIILWTWHDDFIAKELPLRGIEGSLIMEYVRY